MSVLSKPCFHDETAAYAFLEGLLWPNGATCPHCGNADASKIGKLKGSATRIGLKKCYACRQQFTVKVGTVYESSHVPLHKWLQATYLLTSSKKGFTAHQLHRLLDVTYKTAWFMAHRIREAMKDTVSSPVGGNGSVAEVDELHVGPTTYKVRKMPDGEKRVLPNKGSAGKQKIVTLVERNGTARSTDIHRVTSQNVGDILNRHVRPDTRLMTDEAPCYRKAGKGFASHEFVTHSRKEYVLGDVYTNTVEGFFSIFRRGLVGVCQHCGEQQLHRYVAEFDFRYNHRVAVGCDAAVRADLALKGAMGQRLKIPPAPLNVRRNLSAPRLVNSSQKASKASGVRQREV
jgi:transposase-like protein